MSAVDKLSLVIHSGDFSRIHYALVMASAAAAIGKPVTILFAGTSVRLLAKTYVKPDEDHRIKALRVAGFEELLTACRDLGARLLVCETALALCELKPAQLRGDLNLEVAGAVTFLSDASASGEMLFV
jgi:peroxiredoxin family protein